MLDSSFKRLAGFPILAVGISMVSFVLIKIGRDTVFFAERELQHLPLAYLWIALASIPAAMIHLKALDRWGDHTTRSGLLVAAVATLLILVPFVDVQYSRAMMVLFVLAPVLFAAIFASVWLLAGELLEGADRETTRWAYARIGASSMLGGILGGLCAKVISLFLAPRFLVLLGAVILLLVSFIVSAAHRRLETHNPAADPSQLEKGKREREAGEAFAEARTDSSRERPEIPGIPTEHGPGPDPLLGTASLIRSHYILALIAISALASLAALFIDFQFYAIVTIAGKTDAQFFGTFYMALNAATLVLQLTVAPWIQSRYGIAGALMVLPVTLLGGAGTVLLSTTVLSRSLLKVTESGVKASIHRSIWEQVFLPISSKKRGSAKIIVDGISARASEGIGALVLYLWLSGSDAADKLNLSWISWVILGSVILWVLLNRHLAIHGCSDIKQLDYMLRLPDS